MISKQEGKQRSNCITIDEKATLDPKCSMYLQLSRIYIC